MSTFPVLSTDHFDAGIFQALCTRLYLAGLQAARRAIIFSRKFGLLRKKRQPTRVAAGVLFALACVASAISIGTAQAAGQKEIVWTFDVARPGSNLPPTGGSLFDYIFATDRDGRKGYNVPYPFEQLRRRIRIHTQGNGKAEAGFRETLIPLSRALPGLATSKLQTISFWPAAWAVPIDITEATQTSAIKTPATTGVGCRFFFSRSNFLVEMIARRASCKPIGYSLVHNAWKNPASK